MRWLALMGLTIALAMAGMLTDWRLGAILFSLSVWNVFLSILAVLNRRIYAHRFVGILLDMTAGLLLFIFFSDDPAAR